MLLNELDVGSGIRTHKVHLGGSLKFIVIDSDREYILIQD